MPCQDALPAAVSAAAAAMAQGKSDEEVALLAAIFTQLGDSLAMIVALRVRKKRRQRGGIRESVLGRLFFVFVLFAAQGDEHARDQRDGRAEQDARRERFI